MQYFKVVLFIAAFLVSISTYSQDSFISFGETSLALKFKSSKQLSYDLTLRSRYFLFEYTLFYKQQQVDFFLFSNLKLKEFHTISLGVYHRNRNWFDSGSDELRFLQQIHITKQKASIRFGHRIRLEQRIFDEFTTFRPRYRFALDVPINGEKHNNGNLHLVNAAECLLSISEAIKPETDFRISSQLGWQLNDSLKLQTGLEHRIEGFNLTAKHNLFVLTSAVLKI